MERLDQPDGEDVDLDEAVAVVGMSCRVPGAADTAAFWRNLREGVCSVRTFTDDELRESGVDEALLDHPRYVRAAGHLDGVEEFDAEFFGIGAREAARIDPQHRLFLQEAWAAMEDAGHDSARGSAAVGVFAGVAENRYFLFHLFGNPATADAESTPDWDDRLVPGSAPDYLPGRVSYALGLSGPSVAVQTACSSSLVAVCLAAQSLLDFRCDLALAGGSSVRTRRSGYLAHEGGLLSPEGRCRAFDVAASGSVPGSGVGVVVLRRLTDALADGDHVYAVIRGFAVNNDAGQRAGFTAPGVDGQAAVVMEALESCGVDPAAVGFVEAHGSGTPVGDATEVEALRRAFRRGTDRTGFCALGSVKTNIGNLDAAAGVVGLVKAALAVRDGVIPATLHFRRPDPRLDLPSSPFYVNTETVEWPQGCGPRRAGVSSFGLGGTNAHVVLEEPPHCPPSGPSRTYQVLPLSARTPGALAEVAARLRSHLERHPDLPLADVAYTLAVGRRQFDVRAAVVCRDTGEALRALLPGVLPAGGGVVVAPGYGQGSEALGQARATGERWVGGGEVAWEAAYRGQRRYRVPLPTYPFEARRHWIDPPAPRSG